MEKKSIILTRQTKKGKRIMYDNLIHYFNRISSDTNFGYFSLLKHKDKENDRHAMLNIDGFNKMFYANSYSFLDIMFLFIFSHKSQAISVFNFLISNHKFYGQNSVKKYKINNTEYNHISKDDNVIKSRQLFVLGVISLLKDYFAVCDKSKEEKNNNDEQLITFLFEDIFLNNHELINDFKNLNKIKCSAYRTTEVIINAFFITYANEIDRINEVKDKILGYYEEFLLDESINQENRVKYFVNYCDNELIFDFDTMSIDDDIVYDKFELNNNTIKTINVNELKEQNQIYQDLNSAFGELNKMDYQISIPFSKK